MLLFLWNGFSCVFYFVPDSNSFRTKPQTAPQIFPISHIKSTEDCVFNREFVWCPLVMVFIFLLTLSGNEAWYLYYLYYFLWKESSGVWSYTFQQSWMLIQDFFLHGHWGKVRNVAMWLLRKFCAHSVDGDDPSRPHQLRLHVIATPRGRKSPPIWAPPSHQLIRPEGGAGT